MITAVLRWRKHVQLLHKSASYKEEGETTKPRKWYSNVKQRADMVAKDAVHDKRCRLAAFGGFTLVWYTTAVDLADRIDRIYLRAYFEQHSIRRRAFV